ncbi:MAG: TerB N-terminal domain-containing protein [Eubacteriaceae bacterium]|nr:TerB N-terminal domain-containing protein [Eubacteriaceae bacterium]
MEYIVLLAMWVFICLFLSASFGEAGIIIFFVLFFGVPIIWVFLLFNSDNTSTLVSKKKDEDCDSHVLGQLDKKEKQINYSYGKTTNTEFHNVDKQCMPLSDLKELITDKTDETIEVNSPISENVDILDKKNLDEKRFILDENTIPVEAGKNINEPLKKILVETLVNDKSDSVAVNSSSYLIVVDNNRAADKPKYQYVEKIGSGVYEPDKDFNFAEFELIDNRKSDIKAVRIPPRPNRDLTKDVYRKMKDIYSRSFKTSYQIFYEQAKFMENHIENHTPIFDYSVDFMSGFPTYTDMTDEQLRWYFYWRGNVRKKNYIKTSLSYIYVYTYELVNKIGVKDSEDGLNKLIDLWKAYRGEHNHLDKYLPEWIHDYNIVHECNRDYYKLIDELTYEFDKSGGYNNWIAREVLVQMASNQNYELTCNLLERSSDYKFTRSKFYTSQYGHYLVDIVGQSLTEIEKFRFETSNLQLVHLLVGNRKDQRWYPFRNSPFNSEIFSEYQESFIINTMKFWIDKGDWYSTYPQKISNTSKKYIGDIVKATEAYLRDVFQFKGKLKIENIEPSIRAISKGVVTRYCKDNKLFFISKPKIHDDMNGFLKNNNIGAEFHFDRSKLSQIRKDSVEIQNKLIIDCENTLNEEILVSTIESTKIVAEKISILATENVEEKNNWKRFFDSLTEINIKTLKVLIKKEDVNRKLTEIAQNGYTMLEVMLESINEISLECLDDNILDTSDSPPYIYEDYVSEIKKLIIENCDARLNSPENFEVLS